ncbi:MAG: glycosyltransferase [Bacteroidales bacterium]|nr:glycosyltransferase [Bacteroidales bacterium]
MRIAYLSTFYPFRGGIAQFNADLYEALVEAGHEVKAFTFTVQYPSFLFPGKTQYVTEADKAKVIDSEAILNTANPLTYRAAARKIEEWKPDMLVMKYWMSYLAPSLGTVARRLRKKGVKVITILDNVIPHEQKFFDKPFSKWFLKQNDGCIAMSDSVLTDMLSLTPDKKHLLVNHPLYDHFGERISRDEAAARLGIDPGLRTLLFFGLIRDYKGLDLLIDAMSLLDDSYQLVIAGESYGPFEKYDAQIEASPARERIKVFNRYIGDEEVPAFFSAADLCVLPYKSATQSGITAISTHFEVPVVATPVGGLPQSVGEAGIGVITEDVSAEAIAKAVKAFDAAQEASCKAAIAAFKDENTWDKFAEKLVGFTGKRVIPNDILLGEISRILAEGQEVILMTKGSSMLPFLRSEKDSVALRKRDEVAVGDIVLAHLGGGRYVLHRIIAIDGDNVTLMGDGNVKGTESCTKDDIAGTVVRIIKASGKEFTPGKGRFWRLLKPFRRYILAIYRRILKYF